ncbi:hypothetical protein L596_008254 [Steinernema carpocapsae]|uniref:Uncharacterized protein n=1 Tax=Steinernema carpocapsae TaxID=34508 RepID=A0A4U5PC71_STECR|nr:hypothetical protein L596_008254 [Steinernema carpocapsae]
MHPNISYVSVSDYGPEMLPARNFRVPEPVPETRKLEISEKLVVYFPIASHRSCQAFAKERRQTRRSCSRTKTRVSAALNLAQPLLRLHFREVDDTER